MRRILIPAALLVSGALVLLALPGPPTTALPAQTPATAPPATDGPARTVPTTVPEPTTAPAAPVAPATPPAARPAPIPARSHIVVAGVTVAAVQARLHVAVTGTWDDATDAAVRAFQSEQRIVVDALVGPVTKSRLWPVPVPATTPPPARTTPTTVPPAPPGGCSAALAYLSAHAAPGYTFVCGPGSARVGGHHAYGYTCDRDPVCGGRQEIHIACARAFVWQNESANSWPPAAQRDPYGQGSPAERAYCATQV